MAAVQALDDHGSNVDIMDSEAWDARYADADLVWGNEPNQFVRAQCETLAVGVAVDLACGEGRNALWLARLGWQVTGVDYSAVAIERAGILAAQVGARVASRLTWRVDDVATMQLRAESVDLALVSYVHLPAGQRSSLMLRAALAVRPGGHVIVVGHDRRNLREGVSGPQDERLLYDPLELRSLFAGIPATRVDVAETVERHTADGVALDTLVRVRRI
ncbi:MAG: class I SAM-dependent methyltransferase [Propionibacteriales bacterium]|nr:class I SAM-dependent methyltransferase [Propionibacteriales bacterium]